MSLSLSRLFQEQQSQSSIEHKKEEQVQLLGEDDGGNQVDEGSIKRYKNDPDRSTSTDRASAKRTEQNHLKKRKSPPKPSLDNNDHDVGGQQKPATKTKRLKIESLSNNIKNEEDNSEEEIEMEADAENDGEQEHYGQDELFYENYSETAQALYKFQKPKEEGDLQQQQQQPSHSDALKAIHSALFPPKKQSALTLGNERRLAGDYDDEGDGNGNPKSLRGRYQPRKRRIITKGLSGRREITYRLETQSEVQDRVQRMEGYNERTSLRKRWKSRTVNFQSEEDVGNAFLARAEQYLGGKLRADKKERQVEERKERKIQQRQQEREEREKTKELERSDALEEDDEVNEQSQLLAQLSQMDTMLKEENQDSVHPDSGPSSTISPQKLNYWEMGYSMPQKSLTSYNFNPSVEKMVQSASRTAEEVEKNNAKDVVVDESETKASFRALMTQQYGQRSARFFFEPNRTLITNANNTFRPGYRLGHVHHMLSMAARSLCGGGGSGIGGGCMDEIGLENHYLRLLCVRDRDSAMKRDTDATICANFRIGGYLATIAEEQGQNMLLYLQNTWDDPAKVAKKLGILDNYQDSPINGNLLTKITTHSKNNRSKIKRLHKIRSIHWNHDNNNDGIEAEHDDIEEESVILPGGNVIPEVTTSDGVVDAMTMESALTIDKKTALTPSEDSRDALISPNNLYSHIAGTSPPIPQYPLDPSSCLFGPVDRHSKFYHVGVKMDSSIYKLMLSTLIKRISRIRTSNRESVLSKTRKQILDLIEEFADINENKFYLRYTNYIQDSSDSDIPLVEFYRGVTGYCNFMANGYHEMYPSHVSPDNDDVYSLRPEHDDLPQVSGMNQLAEKIWDFCRPKIRRNGLMRFPKIRIIFGVSLICRSLPPSAAEILSRPIDNNGFATPLGLFKHTLEDLETKKSITANRNYEDNCIRAVELEFLFHDAAEFFQEAVKIDPVNVEYQLWHIGCLASCLLISSGNKISDGVRVYPSQKKGTFMNYESAAHEVRQCMKKYNDVRLELSTAVRALFTLAKYQGSAKAHFALFSLLEWGQVIGLLVGSPLKDFLKDIGRLHAFHFKVWAHHEPSAFLREYTGVAKKYCDISFYAQILENDPRKIGNWRKFVQSLGPISKTNKDDWWGKDRCWWGDSLLHIFTPSAANRALGKNDGLVVEIVLARLKKMSNTSPIPMLCSAVTGRSNEEYEDSSDYQSVGWLPTRDSILAQSDDQGDVSKELRSKCYGNDVPPTNKNVPDSENDDNSDIVSSIPIPSAGNIPLPELSSLSEEAQAYKILIFCHLFGLDHPSVHAYLYYKLFSNCFSNKRTKTIDCNCDEFRVLVWLSNMGIGMEDIMRDSVQQACCVQLIQPQQTVKKVSSSNNEKRNRIPASNNRRRSRPKT